MSELTLPPRDSSNLGQPDSERIFRTALGTRDYLLLEKESMERGLKPYSMTKTVMSLFLNRKLVYVKDLPDSLQNQILDHFKTLTARGG